MCITIVMHRCISEYHVWVFKGSLLAAIFHRLKGPFIQALRFKATLKWHNGEVVAFRGAGKARFNVATPNNATVTCNSIRITV